MQPITDRTWREHLAAGQVVEEFSAHGFRMVFLKGPPGPALMTYPYRLLCFPGDKDEPVITADLELSVFGTCCLCVQVDDRHINHGTAEPDMPYDKFRKWALSVVAEFIGNVADERPPCTD